MRKATITLIDNTDGDVEFSVDFGGEIDRSSKSHTTVLWMVRALLEDDMFNVVTDEGDKGVI